MEGWRPPAWAWILFFMAIGLGFRLEMTLWDPLIYPDSTQYMHLAREIAEGKFFGADFDLDQGFIKSRHVPPLYSFLLAPFYYVGDLQTAGAVMSLTFSLLAFLPFFLIGDRLFGRTAAVMGAAVLCFQNFVLWYASPILTESLFTLLYLSVIALSVRAFSFPSKRNFALLGALCALSYATRDVGITAAPICAAGAAAWFGLVHPVPMKRAGVLIGTLLVVFLAVSAPYFIHIRVRTGHWGLTAQMDNTSISRQIQLQGGDKYDRDRLDQTAKPTVLLGEKQAEGVLDLLSLAPLLLSKLFRNLGLYGLEIARKLTAFPFALLLAGVGIAFYDLFGRARREQKFFQLWIVIWLFQLWGLYSLVTPYMVDNRYMYPLIPVALLIAVQAGVRIAGNLGRPQGPASPPGVLALIAAAAALSGGIVFLLTFSPRPDSEVARHFFLTAVTKRDQTAAQAVGAYVSYLMMAAVLVSSLAMLPAARLARRLLRREKTALAAGMGLLAGGCLFYLFGPGPVSFFPPLKEIDQAALTEALGKLFGRYYASLLLLGFGLAMILEITAPWAGRSVRARAASVLIFLGVLFALQYPEFIDIQDRMSREGLVYKYAAGYKSAAREIKRRGLIPPGKVICARKPFIAYYLEGSWYQNQEEGGEPMPKTPAEMAALIKSGAIDYLAMDSFTIKSLRPLLTEQSIGLSPPPGASIVYTRYLPDYNRIITIYDCRRPEPPFQKLGSARPHLERAQKYLGKKEYSFALRELAAALEYEPENFPAWKASRGIFEVFFTCVFRGNVSTAAYAPTVLPMLVKTAKICADLSGEPDDRRIYERYHRLLEEEGRGAAADSLSGAEE